MSTSWNDASNFEKLLASNIVTFTNIAYGNTYEQLPPTKQEVSHPKNQTSEPAQPRIPSSTAKNARKNRLTKLKRKMSGPYNSHTFVGASVHTAPIKTPSRMMPTIRINPSKKIVNPCLTPRLVDNKPVADESSMQNTKKHYSNTVGPEAIRLASNNQFIFCTVQTNNEDDDGVNYFISPNTQMYVVYNDYAKKIDYLPCDINLFLWRSRYYLSPNATANQAGLRDGDIIRVFGERGDMNLDTRFKVIDLLLDVEPAKHMRISANTDADISGLFNQWAEFIGRPASTFVLCHKSYPLPNIGTVKQLELKNDQVLYTTFI